MSNDKKKYQENSQLDSALSLLRSIFESTADGILVSDLKGNITAFNQRFLSLLKLNSSTVFKNDVSGLFKKIAEELIDPTILNNHHHPDFKDINVVFRDELRFIDGRYFERYCHPQIMDHHVVGCVFSFRDITAEKQEEEKKIRAQKEKEEMQTQLFRSSKLATLGTLAAGVAHEINNPLTVITGNIFLLNKKLKLANFPAELLKHIERSREALSRIEQIVNGLRNFARANSDEVSNINIHRVINETISLVDYIARKKCVNIKTELSAANSVIKGNLGKFQQVAMNLITNAFDALDSVPPSQPRNITLSTKNEAEKVIFVCSDSGSGITPDNIQKIFDPFFTTKPVGKGTGLGLSISQSIVANMKGHISVTSKCNEGTSFVLSFPFVNESESVSMEIVDCAGRPKLTGRVLLVDDEEDVREVLHEYLTGFGMEVDDANDGDIALKKLASKRYDLLITDLKMPHMSGEILIKEIVKLKHDRLKIFVITGGILTDYTKEEREIVRQNSHAYLKKPIQEPTLYETISRAFNQT